MRSKVAEYAGGHAFEERFTKLSDMQLLILYKQAITKEREKNDEKYEVIKALNTAWSKNFKGITESLQFFINPEMFNKMMEQRELKVHQKEISTENFLEEWDKLMNLVPETYVVEEGSSINETTTLQDPEFEEMLVGWLSNSKKYSEE